MQFIYSLAKIIWNWNFEDLGLGGGEGLVEDLKWHFTLRGISAGSCQCS